MIEYLDKIDRELFLFLNGIHHEVMDFIMYWVTTQETWYPFYLIIIFLMFLKFGKQAIIPFMTIIIGITLADQVTSSLMKPFFERLRPCHQPEIQHMVRVVAGCGGPYGFASGHAANSFTLATLLFLFFRPFTRYTKWLFLWAFIVAYSRIYVGVHYPGDILFGGLIGILIGQGLYTLYLKLPDNYKLKSG